MTAVTLVRQIANECRAELRVQKLHNADARRSFAIGYFKVAVSHRPQIADHKSLFLRIVDGK